MDWLNYHHLLYFWTVAREGGVSKAAEKLRLAQPTVSAQVRALEEAVGERLFERQGRRLVLTDVGRTVYRYSDEIFTTGRELMDALKGRPTGRPLPLTVGVANAVPKLIVHRLLRPALAARPTVQLVCRENNAEQLVAELATHACDVVLTDTPAPPHVRVRVYNHLLGESGMSLFAAAPLAAKLKRRFPGSLHGAPMLMPTSNTPTRRALDHWLEQHRLMPQVVAEFEDPALMKVFGEAGGVAFVGPTAIEKEISRHYRVLPIGRISAIRERYYAISAERRVKHPGVIAITHAARLMLN